MRARRSASSIRFMCLMPMVMTPRLSSGCSRACAATARTTAVDLVGDRVLLADASLDEGHELVGDDAVRARTREGG